MPNLSNLVLFPAILSGVVTILATLLVINFAGRLGIVDDPKKATHPKVIHTYPVPRGGGVAIFLGILVTALVFLPFDKHLKGILFGGAIIATIGFLDDKYNLNPYLRIGAGFLAAAAPIASGIGIAFISNPLGGIIDLSHPQIAFELFGKTHTIWIISDILALFWIVFLMNMLNMGAKGVDGQLPGVAAIAGAAIIGLSLKFSADITQWPVIILAAITFGAYLGFLPWNFYPQKIMPGYGGSTLAGYLLAVLSILSTAKVGTLVVALGIPLIDTGYTIARRVLAGRSPVWGDTGHLHHRLLAAGMSKRGVSVLYWALTLILSITALNLNTAFKFYTMIGVAVFVGGLILWLTYRPKSEHR